MDSIFGLRFSHRPNTYDLKLTLTTGENNIFNFLNIQRLGLKSCFVGFRRFDDFKLIENREFYTLEVIENRSRKIKSHSSEIF